MENLDVKHWFVKCAILCAILFSRYTLVHAQFVTNGEFNAPASCVNDATGPAGNLNPFYNGCVTGWKCSHRIAKIGDPNPPAYGEVDDTHNLYALLTCSGATGIFSPITLVAGQNYTLSFIARSQSPDPRVAPAKVAIALTQGLISERDFNQLPPNPSPLTQLTQQTLTDNWVLYSVQFVAPTWNNVQLWCYSLEVPSNQYGGSAVNLDAVKIETVCAPQDVYYQNTSSLPGETKTQGKIYAGNSVTSGSTGPVVVTHTVSFVSVGDIALLDGFSAPFDALFSATSVPCPTNNPNATPCNCLGPACTNCRASVQSEPGLSTSAVSDSRTAVFPNPTKGQLTFHLEQAGVTHAGRFIIYNTTGVQVSVIDCQQLTWKAENLSLDVSYLADGLYHYQYVTETYSTEGHFILQK